MLSVCLPGTGGMLPLPQRWLSCCWIEYQGGALLIDCGEGTQISLREAGCKLSHLKMILITHFHADHIMGLPGLLLSLGNTRYTNSLRIVGPPGLKKLLSALLVVAPIPFPLTVTELLPGDELPGWKGLTITCRALDHGTPCYGWRMEVARKPVFNLEKAKQLHIPQQYYRILHAGEPVTLEDDRLILPEQVLDGAREPIVVSYSTDTRPVKAVEELGRNAGLMIAEGLYGDNDQAEKAHEKGHMVFGEAARLAQRAGAKRLWLTHYSPALTDPKAAVIFADEWFPDSVAAHDGIRLELG